MKPAGKTFFAWRELSDLTRALRRFFSHEHKRMLFMVSLWACVLSVLEMLVAAAVAPYVQCLGGQCPRLVESVVNELGWGLVPVLSLGLLLLISLKLLVQARLNWTTVRFNQQVLRDTISRLMQGYLHLDWMHFRAQHRAHYFRRCATTAGDAAWVSHQCITMISSALILMFLVGLMLWLYPLASTLLVACFVTLNLLSQRLIGRVQKRTGQARELVLQHWNVDMAEALASFREIRVYGLEAFFLTHLDRSVQALSRANQKLGFLPTLPRLILDFAVFAILLLVVSIWLILGQPIAELLPHLIFYAVVARSCLPAMMNLLSTRAAMSGSIVNVELILEEFAKADQGRLVRVGVSPVASDVRCYALEQVSFRHAPDAPQVVSGASLQLAHPSWLALVGSSGAGKSTLIELLCGIHVPESGRVLHAWPAGADGQGAPRIAYLPQHVALLDGSIMENVVFGFDAGVVAAVDDALALACLSDTVAALPEGRDTRIGADGGRLSGGERQRLSLARALYRRPDLLLLDEVTSGLDEATENRLLSTLRQQRPEMSVVFITHRSSSLKFADRVIRLQDGVLTDVTPGAAA